MITASLASKPCSAPGLMLSEDDWSVLFKIVAAHAAHERAGTAPFAACTITWPSMIGRRAR